MRVMMSGKSIKGMAGITGRIRAQRYKSSRNEERQLKGQRQAVVRVSGGRRCRVSNIDLSQTSTEHALERTQTSLLLGTRGMRLANKGTRECVCTHNHVYCVQLCN